MLKPNQKEMKNILYISILLVSGISLSAQNYNGVPILGTFSDPDPNFQCSTETGNMNTRLFRDGVASQCPTKPCPTPDLASTNRWISYTMQNLLNQPQCIEIQHNTGTCTFPHSMAILGDTYVPGPHCAGAYQFLGDVGSSVSQSYFVEVPAGELFTIVMEEVSPAGNCEVGFTIIGDVGCAGGEILKPLSGGTSVPTMTQWGLFLFGLIVVTLGVVYIYNMSVRTSTIED